MEFYSVPVLLTWPDSPTSPDFALFMLGPLAGPCNPAVGAGPWDGVRNTESGWV